ncbi:hypothetical protein [Nocardioides kribbensis]|uniref:hypothetical protein n=1 Tax=Nocardioides kribbensis TaxID=305517 RepID=UPI0018791861|nr:hypothetical protein [Nocardioides kribbensis]
MDTRTEHGDWRRVVGYALAWGLAAALAVTIGVLAVTSLGDSIRGRGPLGSNELIRNAEQDDDAPYDPQGESIRTVVRDEFGGFVVECQGFTAIGVEPRPARGWTTVSYETGPDDDVDAIFTSGARSIEVEVFCNAGVPTVAEIERKTLPSQADTG